MDGIGEGVTQGASRNEIAIQALNDVKENVFITTVARRLDNISDFDGAVQLTTEALKEASRRYDRQILITTAWEGLFKTSFFFLVALAVIIAIGQMSTTPIAVSPILMTSLTLLIVASFFPLRRAVRIEAGIKREIDAHSDVLSMLYREKILAKIKSLTEKQNTVGS